ncbi:MAG TPA: hypothetical protein VKZ18_29060 [Polyangia bacterium]|nr:hypothetical protein [Polyangia bacterium]
MSAMLADGVAVGTVALRAVERLGDGSSRATTAEHALVARAIAGLITVVVYVLGSTTHNLYNCAANARELPSRSGCRWIADPRTLAPTKIDQRKFS